MKIKFELSNDKRGGLLWLARDEAGKVRGSICAAFEPASCGMVGIKNHRNGCSRVTASVFHADGSETRVAHIDAHVARLRGDADKWARAWIRDNDIRAKLVAAIK